MNENEVKSEVNNELNANTDTQDLKSKELKPKQSLRMGLRKALVLLAIGAALSYLMHIRWSIQFADIFFICAMMFFLVALMEIVSNIGFFNGLAFGTKSWFRIFRNRIRPSSETKDEYVDYVKNRRKFTDIPMLLLIALVLFIMSVLLSFI